MIDDDAPLSVEIGVPVRPTRRAAANPQLRKTRGKKRSGAAPDPQSQLGLSDDDIARVAALPTMDLFKRPKRGRPSAYDPAFCEQVMRLGENGNSNTQIAVKIGVTKRQLELWAKIYPEFSSALEYAKEASQAWWEDMGMIGIVSENFNSAVWSKSVSSRFKEDYTERKEMSGTVTQKREISISARDLDPEQRENLRQILLEMKRAADGGGDDQP